MTTMALERELSAYTKALPTLLVDEGKFALVVGDQVVGTFDTYEAALRDGYAKAGLEPFLVKRIASVEAIGFFTRDVFTPCQA